MWWLLLLQSVGSVVAVHGLSCSATRGIFLDQGSNPCPPHWQSDSYHWTTREVPQYYPFWLWQLPLRLFSMFPVPPSISSIQHSAGRIVVLNKYWKNEWVDEWIADKRKLYRQLWVSLTQEEPGARWHQDEGLLALPPRRWNCAPPPVWSYLSRATRDFPSPNQRVEF